MDCRIVRNISNLYFDLCQDSPKWTVLPKTTCTGSRWLNDDIISGRYSVFCRVFGYKIFIAGRTSKCHAAAATGHQGIALLEEGAGRIPERRLSE